MACKWWLLTTYVRPGMILRVVHPLPSGFPVGPLGWKQPNRFSQQIVKACEKKKRVAKSYKYDDYDIL